MYLKSLKRKALIFFLILLFVNICDLFSDEKTADMDRLFAKWNKDNTPGAVVAVIKNDKLVYKNAYGMANLEHSIPLQTNSKLNIGSVSKQFTAFCIALLEAKGKISLNDDVRKYIPELPDYGKKITIQNLIFHTSGLRDHQMLIYLGGMDVGELHSLDEVIKRIICRQKNLDFIPGKKYSYCNTGYLLLAAIVHRVSGLSLSEYAHKYVFEPIGMENSFFLDNFNRIITNRAWSYFPDRKGGYINYIDKYDLFGDSGIYTTVEDLFLWTQNLYQGKVGGLEVIKKVLSVGRLNNGKAINYSYGLEHDMYKGLEVVKHDGIWGGYGAMVLHFLEEKFSVICLSNNVVEIDTRRICFQIADIYLKEHYLEEYKIPYQIITLPREELENKIGNYRSPSNGNLMKVSVKGNSLLCEVNSFFKADYAPIGHYEFKSIKPDIPSVYKFVKSDKYSHYVIHTFRKEEKTNVYEPVELYSPSEKELHELSGNYYSEELDNTYSFFVKDGKLHILYKKAPQRSPRNFLRPTIKDEYAAWPSVYHFLRDSKDRVTGFILGTDLNRGISFTKR